jgi:hypothetical protein
VDKLPWTRAQICGEWNAVRKKKLVWAADEDFYSPLQHDFLRLLIIPPAEKHGLAQLAIQGPFRKGYLANELWFTHWILSGIRGGFSNGDLLVKSGFMRSSASLNPCSLNPLPE